MKKFYCMVILFACIAVSVIGQVGINTIGSQPHPSAILEARSTEKGFLPPRMTFAGMNAISTPAPGLMVYCTDCGANGSGRMAVFMNGMWFILKTNCPAPGSPVTGVHTSSYNQITWNWNAVASATGYKWSATNNFTTATDMGTATTKTETGLACLTPYTRYVWGYSSCGTSIPTTLSKSTAANPPASPTAGTHVAAPTQVIWNWNAAAGATGYKWSATNNYAAAIDMGTATTKTETGLACLTPYTRYVWGYSSCGTSIPTTLSQSTAANPPASPTAGTHVAAPTQIVWNWNPVPGATGYKWSSINNYATATDLGTSTTKTETGLNCNTPYTRYAWAYGACGFSTAAILAQTTSACSSCGTSITINHVAGTVAPVTKTVTYGTVTNIPGEPSKCWITRNLGASQQATAVSDATEPSAGWYWQFNRKQGYKHDGTTRTPATTWITAISENSDWISTNDPCAIELGVGWRIPAYTEWNNVDATGNWTNWNGPWNSGLKMHAAGSLFANDGSMQLPGFWGNYWSSTQSGNPWGWFLYLDCGVEQCWYGCIVQESVKANAFSLRCIRN